MPHTAIILAAGLGERLRPLTEETPKCLLPVRGISFLERTLGSCLEEGIRHFKIVTGFQAEKIRSFVQARFPKVHVSFEHNMGYQETNTGYSLFLALQNLNNPALVFDGDLIFDPLLLPRVMKDPEANTMLVDTDKGRLDDEALKVVADGHDHIQRMGKGIPVREATGEFIGLSHLSLPYSRMLHTAMAKLFNSLEPRRTLYYEDVMSALLSANAPLRQASTENARWSEVDTAEDYKELQTWPQ